MLLTSNCNGPRKIKEYPLYFQKLLKFPESRSDEGNFTRVILIFNLTRPMRLHTLIYTIIFVLLSLVLLKLKETIIG